jgi:hypothetical protein
MRKDYRSINPVRLEHNAAILIKDLSLYSCKQDQLPLPFRRGRKRQKWGRA